MITKVSGKNIDKFFFYFVVFDIMFFPYLRVFSVSSSMIVIPIWLFLRGKNIINDRDFKLSIVAIFLCLISFSFSFVKYQDGFQLRDGGVGTSINMAANTVVLLYMFLFYVFFKSLILRYSFKIDKSLIAYLVFVLFLAFIFYWNPVEYFKVRSIWTMYDNTIQVSDFSNAMYRFTSTLSEPNNLAAICVSILAYVVLFDKTTYLVSVILIFLVMAIVFSTMSSSGMIIYLITMIALLINDFLSSKGGNRIVIFKLLIMIFFIAAVFVGFSMFKSTDVGQIATGRVSDNSMSSRYDIWMNAIDFSKIATSLFWGDGGLVVMDGKEFNPHNGHLHLIYSYGLILYLIFMFVFFYPALLKIKLSSFFFVPLIICFTINVGIYEFRFAGLMALLIAAFNAENIRISRI
ncbi:MAG: hypothetical protein RBR82_06065 [Pseudomonas sp.]|nr:hypothetical protein [Pseudomonas sp.]